MHLRDVIAAASNDEIAEAIVTTYTEVVRHYTLHRWKTAGLDAGHFVEAVRRFLELKLFGTATPISKSLPKFNEAAQKKYEQAAGEESYRLLIPRVLLGIYSIRNKRSIGHLGAVPATQIDAALLLNSAKWVVAEIIRLESTGTADETRALVEFVIQRHVDALWQEGDVTRLLDTSYTAREQILILLEMRGDQSPEELRRIVEYRHRANFMKILKRLHESRLIELSENVVKISPKGEFEAERLLARA